MCWKYQTNMSNEYPKISVILPYYNSETTLKRAIESILSQSHTDFELILIDNNSTDNSLNIATSYANLDHRIILISEKQQGVMYASNKGWENSKGDYIARMDSDDWSHPHRLEMQKEFLDKNPTHGAVGTQVRHISHSEFTGGMARFVSWSNSLITDDQISNNRFVELPIVNPSAMWRRKVAHKFGMYLCGEFPEDYEMWLRWMEKKVKIAKINKILLDWYDSDTRISRNHSIYSDKSFYKIKTHYLARWLKENNPFHPDVAIWGASKISRRRAKLLEKYGIKISCYIDTKQNKRQLDKKVYFYKDIPSSKEIFVLTYIKQMDAREQTKDFLSKKGYKDGVSFLSVS